MTRPRPDYAYRTADKVLKDAEQAEKNGAGSRVPNSQPQSEPSQPSISTPGRLITPVSAADLLTMEIEPPQMLIENLWSVEACGYFAGEPKSLKTYSIFDWALAIQTLGKVFGRFQVKRTGPVLIFLEETKPGEAQQRLERLMRGRGIRPNQIKDIHFVVQQRVRLDREGDQDQIRKLCETHQPILCFFDPLVRMREGSENQPEFMNPVLSFLRELQIVYHTGVVLTHHLGKPDKEGSGHLRTAHRIRGTSDQHAWFDSALFFTRIRDNARVQVEVEHREAADPEPFTIGLEVDGEESDAPVKLEHEPGTLLPRV